MLVDNARGVRVSDLGQVQEPYTTDSYTRVGGLPVVLVSVQQTSGSNAVSVVDGVERLIIGTRLPANDAVIQQRHHRPDPHGQRQHHP